MNIERAELLVTLKADKVWKKGTIFDPVKDGHPIPPAIIAEVRANKRTVRVLGAVIEASPVATSSGGVEIAEARLAELEAKIVEAEARLAEIDEKQETALTGADIRRMSHKEILELLEDEEDFESLKNEKRTVLVGIARKRFVK